MFEGSVVVILSKLWFSSLKSALFRQFPFFFFEAELMQRESLRIEHVMHSVNWNYLYLQWQPENSGIGRRLLDLYLLLEIVQFAWDTAIV